MRFLDVMFRGASAGIAKRNQFGCWVRASTHLEARGLTRAIEELSFKWKPSSLECFEFGRKLHAQDRKRKEEVTGKDENEGRSSMSCIVA